MRQIIGKILAMTITAMLCLAPLAAAHEFIIKPVHMHPDPGHKLPFSVVSAHVFMVSEEMEPAEQVNVSLIRGDVRKPISLSKNETLMTLDGAAAFETTGTHILAGHRKGMIWTNTTQGWKQESKKGLSGVLSSGKYEKFCKTLVHAGTADEEYKRVVGHALEIVPKENPALVKSGDEAAFQILFNGRPLSTEVFATYDGFSPRPNTYAYVTGTDENGVAFVKIDAPGLWVVRVQHKLEEATEDYDMHVFRAVLVFNVL